MHSSHHRHCNIQFILVAFPSYISRHFSIPPYSSMIPNFSPLHPTLFTIFQPCASVSRPMPSAPCLRALAVGRVAVVYPVWLISFIVLLLANRVSLLVFFKQRSVHYLTMAAENNWAAFHFLFKWVTTTIDVVHCHYMWIRLMYCHQQLNCLFHGNWAHR